MEERVYRLEDQVGFLLRRANQRHLAVFAEVIPEVTTTQFAALARLAEPRARCRRTSSAGRPRWTRRRSRAWSAGWSTGGW